MRHDNANLQGTVNLHKTVTNIISNPMNGAIFIANGIPYAAVGGNIDPFILGTGAGFPRSNGLLNLMEIPLPENAPVKDIGTYGASAYILFENGNLYTVGENSFGQLGLGDTIDKTRYNLSNTSVDKVFTHMSNANREWTYTRLIIQKTDGTVWGCGYNGFGQLGLNDTTNRNTWTELTWCGTNPMSVWNIGAYVGCTFCQKSDGSVFAAGYNGHGQLGNNSTTQANNPINVTTAWLGDTFNTTNLVIRQVLAGAGSYTTSGDDRVNITMFMDNGTTQRIACAGNNINGTIGNGAVADSNVLVPIVPNIGTGRVVQIGRCGDSNGSVWILKDDGTVWNWGRNAEGQLGRNSTTNSGTPTQVNSDVIRMLNDVVNAYAYGYACSSPILEKADGYYIAGANTYAQLAVGDTSQRNVFTKMLFPSGSQLTVAGFMTTNGDAITRYAVDTEDNIYAWGYNVYNGVTDSNTTNPYTVPVRITPPALIK